MVHVVTRHGVKFVLASIAINALIGIIAIVSGDFSDLDGKVLVTSLSVTGASVLALANLAARARGDLRYIPAAGAVASVIGFALLIAGVWAGFDDDFLWRSAVTGIMIGLGTAHGALLSLSRLKDSYRIVLWVAWGLAALLIVLSLLVIWDTEVEDTTGYLQTVGVVGVLLAAATIAVPVLRWSGRGEVEETRYIEPGEWRTRRCPNCGASNIREDSAGYACGTCGAQFNISFAR